MSTQTTTRLWIALACGAFALLLTSAASALPQWAVQSGRACDTCHTDPTGWPNPELADRKCSLNCNTCHVNPTGGGMRNAGGRFYSRQTLSMFGDRPADEMYKVPKFKIISGGKPASQPSADQGTPIPEGDWYWQMPLDQAPRRGVWPPNVPEAGTAGRYAGIDPFPTFQVGSDVRFMAYDSMEEGQDANFFPMQTDLYLAARPYNPQKLNSGRLTTLVNLGFEGAREEEFDGMADRFFMREFWALYDDLPYQFYAKAGRFLPAYGWKLDDHSAYVRQGMDILGDPFDHERQVTGVEVGINPNYLYANLSAFNAAREWDEPVKGDDGYGTALNAGWRHMGWQVGGQAMYLTNDEKDQILAGANWALNLHWYDVLPIIYMGEVDLNRSSFDTQRNRTQLTAFHEVSWRVIRGIQLDLRYDWQDPDTEVIDDHLHRYIVGIDWYPTSWLEVIAQYRHNREFGNIDNDEIFLQLHGYY